MAWVFVTDCVHSDGGSINEMQEQAKEISYRTMLRAVGRAFIERQAELGYDIDNQRGGLRLSKDWAVSYYKSTYRGVPCYYFVWSHIEQIFVSDRDADRVSGSGDVAPNPFRDWQR